MRTYRTVLEQKIRERQQTFEEFAEYVEIFARKHNEPGTLGVRHLQRLAAGRRPNGQPLGPVQPATARLLEHIFGLAVADLLAPPDQEIANDDAAAELRQMLHASSRIGMATVSAMQEQLSTVRRLDRELGAFVTHHEILTKAEQVEQLLTYCLSSEVGESLAALLSELHCLAGWQALDRGKTSESWRHYSYARSAALHSERSAFVALAVAGQAFVLTDVGEHSAAIELTSAARHTANRDCSPLIRSWLAAAQGESLAASGHYTESLHAFDNAGALLPAMSTEDDGPYIALNPVHLARWRGYALAQCGDRSAIETLSGALDGLDPTFIRAETSLRVDLATAYMAASERSAAGVHIDRADELATQIGSTRQRHRSLNLRKKITKS